MDAADIKGLNNQISLVWCLAGMPVTPERLSSDPSSISYWYSLEGFPVETPVLGAESMFPVWFYLLRTATWLEIPPALLNIFSIICVCAVNA